jgi:hypothetical protein
MGLMLFRHRRQGRVHYTALTAFYRIRFDGDTSGWWAVIRDRDTDKMLDCLTSFDDVEAASKAASEWIRKQRTPA